MQQGIKSATESHLMQ